MGIFDRFRRPQRTTVTDGLRPANEKVDVIVGATKDKDEAQVQSYSFSNITFSGSLSGYDYDAILRDKQNNIVNLYKLADYYCDADPIIRGICKHVFAPYASCSPWVLTGAKDKTVKLFEKQYKKMRLREKLEGIALEYVKYGNVFLYLLNGQLITLPVHKCKIGNIALDGMPIVDFDCQSIYSEWRTKSYVVKENWINDNNLQDYFKGYPPEVREILNHGIQYAQLNPENTFVLQAPKESWQRYAVPFIATCLSSLAKKELISTYEDSILNLGIRSFVHVTYGDEKKGQDMLPDREQLTAVRSLFRQGMSGFPLVVTNQLAKATVVQPDLDDLFQFPKYNDVNTALLSAGGISGILVNGVSEDGSTFASAQISMETASARIESFREEFCEIMNRVNARLIDEIDGVYNLKEPPQFKFMPLDMAGKKALQETCMKLWESGVVSTRTMLETQGYNIDIEREKLAKEKKDGTDEVMIPREQRVAEPEPTQEETQVVDEETRGRKELDDSERTSDPAKAQTGKQPKPSNPEGSMDT